MQSMSPTVNLSIPLANIERIEITDQLPDGGRGAVDRDFSRHGQVACGMAAANGQQRAGDGEFEGIHLGRVSVSKR